MNKFLFLLIGLTLSMLALPSYAEFCDFPYSEPIEGEFAEVGQAVDSDRQRFKVLNAFEGESSNVGSGVGSLSASLLTDRDEIFNKVSKEKSGSIKIGFFQFGKSRKFTNITLNQKYTATFVLVFETTISNAKWKIDTSSGSPLTAYAQRFIDKPCEFKKLFGDSFIFQAQRGAQVYVAINVSFSSDIHYQQFIKGKGTGAADAMGSLLSTKLSDWTDKWTDKDGQPTKTADGKTTIGGRIANLDLGFSFKKSSENTSRTTIEDGKVEIVAMQVGGDTSRLGQIFGTGEDVAIASCRLSALVDEGGQPTGGDPTSISNCSKAFGSVLAYLAQEEFATGVKASPATLSYLYRPYWEVDPSIQLVKEITPAIEDARTQLATQLSNRERNLEVIKELLASSLTSAHRQELTTLQSNLEQDIQRLLTAGFTCFSDLASCESLSTQVLGNLTIYKQSVLQRYLEDGMVASYPFDGDALDKSGNGNDGTVHGATLTQDRFGKGNSAYRFEGDNYILVPGSSSLNTMGNFALSVWVRSASTPQHSGLFHKEPLTNSGARVTGYQAYINPRTNNWSMSVHNDWPSTSGGALSTIKVVDSSWHHLVAIYDWKTISIYTDGKLDSMVSYDKGMFANNSPLYIGVDPDAWGRRDFRGELDDIRIYNRVLSDDEIQRLYTGDTLPIETYHLSVNKTGDGNVTEAGDYEANSSVTLTAVANANSQFIGWSGDCSGTTNSTTLLMDADKTCMAEFGKKTTDPNDPEPKPTCGNPFLPCDEPVKSSDKCTASYQNNTLIIPCLNIANLFTTETYQVELKQQLFSMTFNVNMDSLQSKSTVKDACAAEYKGANGEVHVPCVEITGTSDMYDVYLQQQPSTLLFDLDMKRLVKTK